MLVTSIAGRALDDLSGDVVHRLETRLRGFAPAGSQSVRSSDEAYGADISWGEPFEPWVLLFILVEVIGGDPVVRPFEKVAWVVEVPFEGTLMQFRHQKFGLGATLWQTGLDDREAGAIFRSALQSMEKALPTVDRGLLTPRVNALIDSGNVTIDNQYGYFREMALHFRTQAEASAERAKVAEPEHSEEANGGQTLFPAVDIARESEFAAHAALYALFSLIEHLLVISLAFQAEGPEGLELEKFLRLPWGKKFTSVVDIDAPRNKRIYDVLKILADENRNPAAHGGVDRRSTNLSVHMPGYGAVPIGVTAAARQPTYGFAPQLPLSVSPFQQRNSIGAGRPGWAAFDEVLLWLENGPLALPLRYGSSGLPILMDPSSRKRCREAADGEGLDEWLNEVCWRLDRASNMDW